MVAWRGFPANSGALGEGATSPKSWSRFGAKRLGGMANTCPLSSVSIGKWVGRYREVTLAAFAAAPSL
jgi:hypothetical protein